MARASASARRQVRRLRVAGYGGALPRCRKCDRVRLHGRGWWDDITGFFTKAYDNTIGKIPVVGDAIRAAAGTVLNPVNTLGKVAQAATSGDFKKAGMEIVEGARRTITQPSIAEVVTKGTPLEGIVKQVKDVGEQVVRVPGLGMSVKDLKDGIGTAADIGEALLNGVKPSEIVGAMAGGARCPAGWEAWDGL